VHKHYDYIIAGAGAAGLSLAWQLLQSPLSEKNVLLVDENLEPRNDKTWCFWDAQTPPFGDIIYKKWDHVEIGTTKSRFTQELTQYPYYCLRSIDFQKKIIQAVESNPYFDLLESNIIDFQSSDDRATVQLPDKSVHADYIFQSCFNPWHQTIDNPRYPLLQHFLGWEIELNKPIFDEHSFTLMDFDETFSGGVAFIYLLPWSQQSGLIEYTIFSDRVVSEELYEEKISIYLNNRFNLKPIDYQITRREFGKIPMIDRPANQWLQSRIMNIGTVGGVTKPSTGYTFQRIQDHSKKITDAILNGDLVKLDSPSEWRYKAYDLWLLQIIHDHPTDALQVFNQLFNNNSADLLFRFLGEETTLAEDLKIMSSVPYYPFLRAIWKTRRRLREI
jgi:lycopene beta-cyclase